MNEIVSKFLLVRVKFMLEMHLKQPRFIYSAYGPFTKNKERIQKLKKTRDSKYIYKKLAFNTTWLTEILKIYQEGQLLIKYYIIKHLTLLKIQNMMDIKDILL